MKHKQSNCVALDLGTNKISGIVANIDKKSNINILAQTFNYSKGLNSGFITDIKALENCIMEVIFTLEKQCGKNIKDVIIAIPGLGTKSWYVNDTMKLSNNIISKTDVKRLMQRMLSEFKKTSHDIIHYIPIEFIINNEHVVDDPIGMCGKELSCQLHIITVDSIIVTNLANCLAKCHLQITKVMLSIYASGIACLSKDEKDLGALIISIGAKITSFGVFAYDKLIYTGHVNLGGLDITHEIAKNFAINVHSAEKLKILYGKASISSFDKDQPINFETIEPNNLYEQRSIITTHQLSHVINKKMEEILYAVKKQYDNAKVDNLIARRLVLTGGGANLRGVKEVAAKVFDKQIRIGKSQIYDGLSEEYNSCSYSSVIGIAESAAINQHNTILENLENSWIKNFIKWFKTNI
ncbi:MAG: cell division protein FtsA [Rickettsiaceae bacterium]